MNPKISIITPAYNSEKYISETIESVLKQTFFDWEMIVVDDGSTDLTEKVVMSYASRDGRIRYYKLDRNYGGPSIPRNYAIDRSRGDYLAFLDSDDLWLPEKLERQLSFMKLNNLEFSYGPTKFTIGNDESIAKLGNRSEMLMPGNISCLTVMVRNRVEYRPIFDEEPFLKAAEDTYAWIQMHKKTNRIGYYKRFLSVYRVNGEGSISGEFHSDICKRMAKQFLYYSKLHLTNAITNREAVNCYFRVLYNNSTAWARRFLISWLKKIYPVRC